MNWLPESGKTIRTNPYFFAHVDLLNFDNVLVEVESIS